MHAGPDICTRPGWFPGVILSLTALLMFHGYAYCLNWVSFALAKHRFLRLTPRSDSSLILHGALYPSIECWQLQFSLDTRSGPLDCGASYLLVHLWEHFIIQDGVYSFVHCTQIMLASSSSSTYKTPWDYPMTNAHCGRYSINKIMLSAPCLAMPIAKQFSVSNDWSGNMVMGCIGLKIPYAFELDSPIQSPNALHSCGPWHSYNIPSDDGSHAHCFVAAAPFAFIKLWLFDMDKRFCYATPQHFFKHHLW